MESSLGPAGWPKPALRRYFPYLDSNNSMPRPEPSGRPDQVVEVVLGAGGVSKSISEIPPGRTTEALSTLTWTNPGAPRITRASPLRGIALCCPAGSVSATTVVPAELVTSTQEAPL